MEATDQMSKKELITRELERVPDDSLDEVLNFVRWLQNLASRLC
jgi:hypothetical protein